MAADTTLVSVEEYLRTNYQPYREYIDGVLRPKPLPTWDHGTLEYRVCELINSRYPAFAAANEVIVQIRPGKYLIPDIAVQRRDRIQRPYPTDPVHICIEILSPDDRVSDLYRKCEEYHDWGVETTWIADPVSRRAWEFRKAQLPNEVPADGALTAEGISIPLTDVFSVL